MSRLLEKKKLSSKTLDLVGKDAGPYEDDYKNQLAEKIQKLIDSANHDFGRAVYAWAVNKKDYASESVNFAIKSLTEAFWIADETDLEDEPHNLLHRIAKWKHDNLGCVLIREGDYYIQRCAIAITHNRVGFSAGFTSDSICSICGQDEFECEHSKDRTYWVRGGKNMEGKCSVCLGENCSDHTEDFIYKTRPITSLKNLVLHEVSVVRKPVFQTARLQELKYHKSEVEGSVGKINESMGMVYKCHVCGNTCPGFEEFSMPST